MKNHQEKVDHGEQYCTAHEDFDRPYVPALNGDSKVEVADREFEGAVGENVKDLAQIPKLWVIKIKFPWAEAMLLTSRAILASSSSSSHRCLPVP